MKPDRRAINMTGKRCHRLTVLEFAGSQRKQGGKVSVAMWKCRCTCDAIVIVAGTALRMGLTRSCGRCARSDAGVRGWMKRRAAKKVSTL